MTEGTLFMMATPIGNLDDISPRALDVIKHCDLIYSENPNTTRKLLSKFEISKVIHSYRESNHERISSEIINNVKDKDLSIVIVSEAGTPVVSDPGAKLLNDAYEAGIKIIPIPGPSAVATAVSVFPLAGTRFLFWGFAPRKEGALNKMIDDNLELLVKKKTAIVCFESPFRLKKTLSRLSTIRTRLLEDNVDLKVGLGKEMTKVFEAYEFGTPNSILEMNSAEFDLEKGEATLVIVLKKMQNKD